MSIVFTDSSNYAAIADAIRQKSHSKGTYLPKQMAEAILTIHSGDSAPLTVHFTDPLTEGLICIHVFVDCVVQRAISLSDIVCSSNVKSIEYVSPNQVNLYLEKALSPNEELSLQFLPSAYVYLNGVSMNETKNALPLLELSVNALHERKPTDIIPIPRFTDEDLLIVYNSHADSGKWSAQTIWPYTTNIFNGSLGDTAHTMSINADSYIDISGITLSVNQRDAAVNYIGVMLGTCEIGQYSRCKWRGMSHYSEGQNQIWEVIFFENGDASLKIMQYGPHKDGTCRLGNCYFSISDMPEYVSFYRIDKPGTHWKYDYEPYVASKHISTADNLVVPITLADALNFSPHIRASGGGDGGYYHVNVPADFSWNYEGKEVTNFRCNGDSFIGFAADAQHAALNRRDAALTNGYETLFNFTDLDNLACTRITWHGRSHYSGNVDQTWSIWLFKNGDAMFTVEKHGATGSGGAYFLGKTFNGDTGSIYSFYRKDTEGKLWKMKKGIYNLADRPHERELPEILSIACVDILMTDGHNIGTGGATYNAESKNGGSFYNNAFEVKTGGTLVVPYKLTAEPWSFEIVIDTWQESSVNQHGRFFRGNRDVPSIYYTKSAAGIQFKINATRVYANNVSWYDDTYVEYTNGDKSDSLLLPLKKDEKTHIFFRNDGATITLFINGKKIAYAPTANFTSDYQADTLAIGDDDNRGYDLEYLACSCLRIWNEELSDNEINLLYADSIKEENK